MPIRQHISTSLDAIMAQQHERPAVLLLVGVAASPISNAAQPIESRVCRYIVELHIEELFVVNLGMMRERENRNLVEVPEYHASRLRR